MEVTKEEFKKYVKVQESGITNMMAISTVKELTGLSTGTILEIMEDYGQLEEKYN